MENKKILLWNKINIALSIVLLVLASFWVLQNIYEGRPFYAGNSLIWIHNYRECDYGCSYVLLDNIGVLY